MEHISILFSVVPCQQWNDFSIHLNCKTRFSRGRSHRVGNAKLKSKLLFLIANYFLLDVYGTTADTLLSSLSSSSFRKRPNGLVNFTKYKHSWEGFFF